MVEQLKEHYTDTIFYQIELTARYCKFLGAQVFDKFGADITCEEFTVLDVLMCNPELCQRDLAKILFKDRANTGKLLDTLEKKGFVTRDLAVKNNRPVKIVKITEKGVKMAIESAEKIRPHYVHIKDKVNNSDIAKVGELLKELREILKESLEIQI